MSRWLKGLLLAVGLVVGGAQIAQSQGTLWIFQNARLPLFTKQYLCTDASGNIVLPSGCSGASGGVNSVNPSAPITSSITGGSVLNIGLSTPLALIYGGTGVTAPAPTTSTSGCGTLGYSGTWPSNLLTGTFTGCIGATSFTYTPTSPISGSWTSGTDTLSVTCPNCAVTNANNNFSANQTIAPTASTGSLQLGGATSHCVQDYNVTIVGFDTIGCGLNVAGTLETIGASENIQATGSGSIIQTSSGPVVAGAGTAPTALVGGQLYSSTSVTAGAVVIGGSTHRGALDFGQTVAGTFNFASDAASANVQDQGALLAYAGTAAGVTQAAGDIDSEETASTGKYCNGGSTANSCWDFGVTTSAWNTFNAKTQVNGILMAGIPTTIAPTAATGYLVSSVSTTSGAIDFGQGGTGTNCRLDYGITNTGDVAFNCPYKGTNAFTTTGLITGGNFLDTGLGSATNSPLCGANATNVSQCASQNPLFATTGNTSKASGTTANTYQQLGSNISVTTGTSLGATGKWLVHVQEEINIATASSAQFIYGCVSSATTLTAEDSTTDGASTCVTALTNSIAGGPGLGMTTDATNGRLGLAQIIYANVEVANSTTFTATCDIAASGTTSETVFGHCDIRADPI